jgi:hypothetical protein
VTSLEGNEALLKMGARPFPNAPWHDGLRRILFEAETVPAATQGSLF